MSAVNHPDHYNTHRFLPREAIDYMKHMGSLTGNAFKYVYRYPYKGTPLTDIRKARTYLRSFRDNPGSVRGEFPEHLLTEIADATESLTDKTEINEAKALLTLALLSSSTRFAVGTYFNEVCDMCDSALKSIEDSLVSNGHEV